MKKVLGLAAVLSAACYSYSYSDVVYGVTNNAAGNGFSWDMSNVLPPQAGLTIGGIAYKYSVEKERDDAFNVTVGNEDAINGGYIIEYKDDWTGLPGNTLTKQYPLPDILIDRVGDGSIVTEGTGIVTDPEVRYTYKYDECYNPLADPECPGYADAYLAYLLANGLLNTEPPEVDDITLEEVTYEGEQQEQEAKEVLEEEEEEEEELEKLLSIRDEADAIAKQFAQMQLLMALNNNALLKPYVDLSIGGGIYDDTVELKDKKINDNRSAALRMGLAQDQVHEQIVASQYDKGE